MQRIKKNRFGRIIVVVLMLDCVIDFFVLIAGSLGVAVGLH